MIEEETLKQEIPVAKTETLNESPKIEASPIKEVEQVVTNEPKGLDHTKEQYKALDGTIKTRDTISGAPVVEKPKEEIKAPVLETPKETLKPETIDKTITDIATFKKAGGGMSNLEQLVENRYKTIADVKGNKVTAVIGDKTYEWVLDGEGNPIKKEVKQPEVKNKENVVGDFQRMVNSGSSFEDLVSYKMKNKEFGQDLDLIIKDHFKNKSNLEYYQKYSNKSASELYEDSDFVKGTKQYDLLPDNLKAEYEKYAQIRQQNEILEKRKNLDFTPPAPPEYHSPSLADKTKELYNSEEYKTAQSKMTTTQTKINEVDEALDSLEDDYIAKNPQKTKSEIASWVADKQGPLIKKKNSLINQFNTELATYKNLESDINNQIQTFKYDDANAKQEYQNKYNQYVNYRNRMDKFDLIKFQEDSKLQAENRSRQWQMAIKENDRQYADSKKKGVYKTDTDGSLLYVVDGVANVVKKSDGKVVGVKKYKDYTDTINNNKDGTFNILRQYENGKVEVFTRGVTGTDSFNSSMKVESAIGNVESYKKRYYDGKRGYQCGEAVNNYLKTLGINSVKMGSLYKDKTDDINSKVPIIGGIAVWQAGQTETKYGHTGIVTGYNEKTGEVMITDWNLDGKTGQKTTHKVQLSEILNSDGGFVDIGTQPKPTTGTSDTGVSETDIKVFNNLTPSEASKQKDNPKYQNFIKQKNKIMADENADVYDVLNYSDGGKDLATSQVQSISKYTATLNSLGEIQKTIEEGGGFFGDGTGPVQGILRSADPYDTQAQKLKAQITSLIPNLARGVYGEVGVLTEADVDLYRKTVPNLKQTDDVNKAVLGMTLRLVRNGLKEQMQDLARGGYNVSYYDGKIKKIDKEIDVIEKGLGIGKETPTKEPKNFMTDYKSQDIKTPSGFVYKTGNTKKIDDFFNN